jgi:hypothetical protein
VYSPELGVFVGREAPSLNWLGVFYLQYLLLLTILH